MQSSAYSNPTATYEQLAHVWHVLPLTCEHHMLGAEVQGVMQMMQETQNRCWDCSACRSWSWAADCSSTLVTL